MLAAINGVQKHPISPHRPAFLGISEPDIQQRSRRTVLATGLNVFEGELGVCQGRVERLVTRRSGVCRVQPGDFGFGPRLRQNIDGTAIELFVPTPPAIHAVQDHAVMADRPALLRIDKMHRRQQHLDRHLSLSETAVDGAQQHSPSLANQ